MRPPAPGPVQRCSPLSRPPRRPWRPFPEVATTPCHGNTTCPDDIIVSTSIRRGKGQRSLVPDARAGHQPGRLGRRCPGTERRASLRCELNRYALRIPGLGIPRRSDAVAPDRRRCRGFIEVRPGHRIMQAMSSSIAGAASTPECRLQTGPPQEQADGPNHPLTCNEAEPTSGLEPGTPCPQGSPNRPGRRFAVEHRAQQRSKTPTGSHPVHGRSRPVVA